MHRLALVIAALAVSRAWAAGLPEPPAGAIQSGDNGTLVVSSQTCDALGAVPDAAYTPGVDASGNSVAPADLASSTPPLKTDNFPVEISRRLAGQFGVPAAGGAYGAKAILGYVTVKNNEAYFNGQALSADQSAALGEACAAAKK